MRLKMLLLLLASIISLASCTKRKPEEIDYAPNSPWNPYPPDSATNVEHTTLDVTLSWAASDPNSGDVLTYTIYLDTLNPPLTSIASGLTSPSFPLTGLSYNTTYYWNLYITDDQGVTTSGPVWRFTTLPHANSAPTVPSYLYPVANAPGLYPTLNFGWNCTDPEGSSDTLLYDLYLGVSPQPPLTPVRNDSVMVREITGLEYATTYYWKVVVHDNHYAYASGPVYAFTTRDCPWFYKRELPSPRYGFGTAVVNGKIYVIGGTDGANYMNEVLEYDPLWDTWTRKADMPTARSDLAVTAWNNKIYAIGGKSSFDIFDKNEVYDPSSDTWTNLAPEPSASYGITAHAVNGKILVLGGKHVSEIYGLRYFGGVVEYNIATDAWWDTTYYRIFYDSLNVDSIIWIDTIYSQVKSLLPNANCNNCSAVYNNLIYVMGGAGLTGLLLPTMDVYHPANNTWSTASNMLGPANFPAATVANGFIYVIGGYSLGYLRRVRKYDPATNTWAVRGDMQEYRASFGAAFVNDCIYAIGGTGMFPCPRWKNTG